MKLSEPPETSQAPRRLRARLHGVPGQPGSCWYLRPRVVLIAGALAWFAAESVYSWRNPLANAKFTRLLDFAGTEQAAAISRDGKFVAFLGSGTGKPTLGYSEVGSGTYRNLTHGDVRDLVNPLNPYARLLGGLVARYTSGRGERAARSPAT